MCASPERRPILVLQHAGSEPPGTYEDELLVRGIPFERVVLDEGGELPDWRAFAGIVAMGGTMSVNDEARHTWLVPEKRLIAQAVADGRPYWGVCLGAQLLAASLGARVWPGERPELGVLGVELTEAAASDPVFSRAPRAFRTLQWHRETYELPAGAVQLARSDSYEQQAFAIGRAYALQFHLEVDSALAGAWMREPASIAEVQQAGGAPSALLAQVDDAERETVALGRRLFAGWLLGVVGYEGRPA